MYLTALLSTSALVKHALRMREPCIGMDIVETGVFCLGAAVCFRGPLFEALASAGGELVAAASALGGFLATSGSLLVTTACCTVVGACVVWGGVRR
jgi:hypothetical protein